MAHDLRRQSTDILPVLSYIYYTDLFTLHHARLNVFPCNRNMSGHFQLLELCGQRNDNTGRRELVPHIILNNESGTIAALHMAVLRNRNVNENNISTLIRFHSYLQYRKRSKRSIFLSRSFLIACLVFSHSSRSFRYCSQEIWQVSVRNWQL